MKKAFKVLIMSFIILILASCTKYHDNLNVNFKQDKMSSLGYAAAVYEDRIYYVSNESGIAGIYSMNLDGSDVKLEVTNPSVTQIELCNGTLYFQGLYRIGKVQASDQFDTRNKHALYYCALNSDIHNFNDEITIGSINKYNNYNTMEFYVSKEGYKAVSFGAMMEGLFLFDPNSQPIELSDVQKAPVSFKYNKAERDENGDTNYSNEDVQRDIYQFGDLLIFSDYYSSVIDVATGNLVLKFHDGSYQGNSLKAYFMDEKNIYCSYNEMVIVLDRNTFDLKTNIIPEDISDSYCVDYMIECRGKILLVADEWGDSSTRTLPLVDEKLYIMDPETFECKKIMDISSNQRILGIFADYILFLDNEQIYMIDFSNGTLGEKHKLIDAPSDINTQLYTLDYAGDWMFIYKTYPEYKSGSDLPGQQLLYKINLQTGEVIENDVKLDFSALDSYKEK